MELQKSAVIETGQQRLVEMTFAEKSEVYDTDPVMILRLAVDREGYPRLLKAQLEALQHARDVINHEIQQIEHIRGQAFPSEDWRK